jgi:ATP-dependent DNA ligase
MLAGGRSYRGVAGMKRHCVFSLTASMPKRTEVDRRGGATRHKVKSTIPVAELAHPPTWIKPQLTRLVEEAPTGKEWLHEIKYDGYRMHARIDGDKIQLLTRTGLDWSHRYKRTIEGLRSLQVKSAYLDGELCALNADGVPVLLTLVEIGNALEARGLRTPHGHTTWRPVQVWRLLAAAGRGRADDSR